MKYVEQSNTHLSEALWTIYNKNAYLRPISVPNTTSYHYIVNREFDNFKYRKALKVDERGAEASGKFQKNRKIQDTRRSVQRSIANWTSSGVNVGELLEQAYSVSHGATILHS